MDWLLNVLTMSSLLITDVPNGHLILCEFGSDRITCDLGKVIHVVGANYGRTKEGLVGTCSAKGYPGNPDCVQPLATQIVVGDCEGKMWCDLEANNAKFPDPCSGVPKYLEVNYTCFDSNETSTVMTSTNDAQTSSDTPLFTTDDGTDFTYPQTTNGIENGNSFTCCCATWNPNINITDETEKVLEEIREKLRISKNKTSNYERSLNSADDTRTSATVIGIMLGVVVIISVIGFIVFLDLSDCCCGNEVSGMRKVR